MSKTPDPINIKLMLEAVNNNNSMKSFLLTYLHGSARKGTFSAEDFREMMNSPISNVFQRMVFTGVSLIENVKALVKERIKALIHNLDLKEHRKHAREFDFDDIGYERWGLHIEQDAPTLTLKKLVIKLKEGLFASRAQILADALSRMVDSALKAKHYYSHVMKQYQMRVELHFKEYSDLAQRFELVDDHKLSPAQIASLHTVYHQYHQEQVRSQQRDILRAFLILTPAPRFRNAGQFEELVKTFFDSQELRQSMVRHNQEHRFFGNTLSQVVDSVIYYQQATIELQSELNFTLKLWQMKNPNFEFTPKPGTKGLVNQEEDQRVVVPEHRNITPFQMQPRPDWLVAEV